MSDRLPSDHPSVTTVRARLERTGGLDRPRIVVPTEERGRFPVDEVVRLVLDGTEFRARVDRGIGDDEVVIRGAFESPRLARNPGSGENKLIEWRRAHDVSYGSSVLLDVVEPDFLYGLRAPGERAVYQAREAPKSSLADIARRLEADREE